MPRKKINDDNDEYVTIKPKPNEALLIFQTLMWLIVAMVLIAFVCGILVAKWWLV